MTIADRIRQRRIELSLSQEELAKRLGYKDKTSISKIENSGDNVSLKKIRKLSDALKISPHKLLGDPVERDLVDSSMSISPRMERILSEVSKHKVMEYFVESLTDFELDIIDAYRDASDDTKSAICAILGLRKED